MKTLLMLLLLSPIAIAQTTTGTTTGTNSDSAIIISTSGQASLSPQETATLKHAIEALQHAQAEAKAAETNLQTVQMTIAANHSDAAPYQITTDFSTTISQVPDPVTQIWTKVATEGQTVLIKAGTTVRFGVPMSAIGGSGSTPLTADAWDPPVTFSVDTTILVSYSNFAPDPAPYYTKELDMLGSTGGVTVQ